MLGLFNSKEKKKKKRETNKQNLFSLKLFLKFNRNSVQIMLPLLDFQISDITFIDRMVDLLLVHNSKPMYKPA